MYLDTTTSCLLPKVVYPIWPSSLRSINTSSIIVVGPRPSNRVSNNSGSAESPCRIASESVVRLSRASVVQAVLYASRSATRSRINSAASIPDSQAELFESIEYEYRNTSHAHMRFGGCDREIRRAQRHTQGRKIPRKMTPRINVRVRATAAGFERARLKEKVCRVLLILY
jgi:hypothetical protein